MSDDGPIARLNAEVVRVHQEAEQALLDGRFDHAGVLHHLAGIHRRLAAQLDASAERVHRRSQPCSADEAGAADRSIGDQVEADLNAATAATAEINAQLAAQGRVITDILEAAVYRYGLDDAAVVREGAHNYQRIADELNAEADRLAADRELEP